MHHDRRGCFTEVFRQHWDCPIQPVQWNVVRSVAKVLRGVHLHRRHGDYLLVVSGRALVGLADLRPHSPTRWTAGLVELHAAELTALEIPPGVAHGFYFAEPSLHLYAVSHYWDPADELGCRWDDPHLGIPWPAVTPLLSPRDEVLGSLARRAHRENLTERAVANLLSMGPERWEVPWEETRPAPCYEPGTELSFRQGEAGTAYLVRGFAHPED